MTCAPIGSGLGIPTGVVSLDDIVLEWWKSPDLGGSAAKGDLDEQRTGR